MCNTSTSSLSLKISLSWIGLPEAFKNQHPSRYTTICAPPPWQLCIHKHFSKHTAVFPSLQGTLQWFTLSLIITITFTRTLNKLFTLKSHLFVFYYYYYTKSSGAFFYFPQQKCPHNISNASTHTHIHWHIQHAITGACSVMERRSLEPRWKVDRRHMEQHTEVRKQERNTHPYFSWTAAAADISWILIFNFRIGIKAWRNDSVSNGLVVSKLVL